MKKVEVVAAIIKNNGSILCCQRESNKLSYLSEKWEFPGGRDEGTFPFAMIFSCLTPYFTQSTLIKHLGCF